MKKLLFSFILLSGVVTTNLSAHNLEAFGEPSIQHCAYNKSQAFAGMDALAVDINKCIDGCMWVLDMIGYWEYYQCLNYCKENGTH